MFEITKPPTQHRVQVLNNVFEAVSSRAPGLGPNAIPQGVQTFAADPSSSGLDPISQKLEALPRYRAIPHVGFVRMQGQTVCRYPGDHSISNHLTSPCPGFNTLPLSSAGPLSSGRGFAILQAGSPATPGRIEFVILRTGRSPPVASHPASWRRSSLRLQARRAIGLKRTCTSLTSCAHGRTRSGFQPRCNRIIAAGSRSYDSKRHKQSGC